MRHDDNKGQGASGAQAAQASRLLVRAAGPDRAHVGRAILGLALAAGLEVLGPLLGKTLIDEHLLPHRLDWPHMALLLGGVLLAGWGVSWLRYRELVRLSGLAMRAVRRLRVWVYGHVLHLPMTFFDRAITGQLVSRVTNDTEAVKSLYIQVLFVILDSTVVLLGTSIAMAWLDWRLMLIVLTLLPAVAGIVWLYQRLSASAVARARALRSEINARMAESIGGMSILQASNAERRYAKRFAATNGRHYRARMDELRANAFLLRPALDFMNVLLLAAVIFMVGRGRFGSVEIGLLYAFISYVARVVEPLIQITMQFSGLQQAIVATARVAALLDEGNAEEHTSVGATAPASRDTAAGPDVPALSVRGLDFGYAPGTAVLHDLSLEVPQGAFIGIVGHTGSGKSTFLSLLLRYYAFERGSITLFGEPLGAIGNERFRNEVGVVPQEPFLLAASVRENIDMGRGLPMEAIEAAARAAHVHGLITRLEFGYDTPLGEGGSRLSSGQKQLLAIARALAGRPRILLLDEATSRIDSHTELIVQQALAKLRGTVTVIAIAHRLSTIRDADQVIVLSHGRIVEAGTHEALMRVAGGTYQRLYSLQQSEA